MDVFLWIIVALIVFWFVRKHYQSTDADAQNENAARTDNFSSRPARSQASGSQSIRRHKSSGWIPKNGNANVSGRDIGGMVYVGIPPRSGRYEGACGAYIDPCLSVARQGGDLAGGGMYYWPSYSEIDARSRATYLDWLATGRSDSRYNPGYMFLYFYGLERRFFLDDPKEDEKREILEEAKRLNEVYSENGSARNYLGRFVDVASMAISSDEEATPIYSSAEYEMPFSLTMTLGAMVANEERLSADWALSWLLCHPERQLRTPAKRCENEFHALFRLKFNEKYPEGMKVRRPKKVLKAEYRAASGEFSCDLTPTADNQPIPDVSGIRKPVNDAQKIADNAMDELDKYSRFLGRNPDGRGTMEAQALLPSRLWSLFPSEELESLKEWLCIAVEQGGLVPAHELIEKLEGARPDKLGKRQLTGAADALARIGYGMAPDPRFALRSPKFGEPVVVFELPEGLDRLEDVSVAYRSALLETALATFIAQADGEIVPAEENALRNAVEDVRDLTASERARLSANLAWMLSVQPDMSLLRKRLKDATDEQKEVFRQVVVRMAHVDSVVQPEEVSVIEKVYKALGLDAATVYTDIHSAALSDAPVAIRDATVGQSGEPIPALKPVTGTRPVLDATRIAAIQSDTERVSSVLGEIFGSDDPEEVEESTELEEINSQFLGLDAKHSAFAAELIGRKKWSEKDFAELASRYRLMASGCVETLNEWSFERFDDALIEEYDGFELNLEIVNSLVATGHGDHQHGGA